jgi:tetratricopeptide (TPR) repeat protein
MSVDELLSEAIRLENAGNRTPAIELLGKVLAREPKNFDARLHLGTMFAAEGHFDHASSVLHPFVNFDYSPAAIAGDTVTRVGESMLDPRLAADAAVPYRHAIERDPERRDALRVLGFLAEAQGRLDEATQHRERHLSLDRDSAEALQNLGRVLGRRGEMLRAAELLRRGFAIEPDRSKMAYELGLVEAELGRHEEAIAAFRRALSVDPTDVRACGNLGQACMALGRWEGALDAFIRAAALTPGKAWCHWHVGAMMLNLGRPNEALPRFDEVVRIDPDDPAGHVGRGLALLQTGDLVRGWPEYEERWRLPPFNEATFDRPRWDGTSLAGRSILLTCEQGLGDVIQFIRYVPVLKAMGAAVFVCCQPGLVSLFSRSPGIDGIVVNGQPPPATDFYASMLSLPAILRTRLDGIPAQVPYVFPEESRVADWKRRLAPLRGLKVGIAWKGNPKHPLDLDRSVAPDWFAMLAALPGVHLVSLQKGEPAPPFPVTDLADQLTDFDETAAVVRNLDLVIAVDTSVVHLAGALGVPVWVALPFASDWRWLRDREDSPWYPTMWLVRQPRMRDWRTVFDRIAAALEAFASQAGSEPERTSSAFS